MFLNIYSLFVFIFFGWYCSCLFVSFLNCSLTPAPYLQPMIRHSHQSCPTQYTFPGGRRILPPAPGRRLLAPIGCDRVSRPDWGEGHQCFNWIQLQTIHAWGDVDFMHTHDGVMSEKTTLSCSWTEQNKALKSFSLCFVWPEASLCHCCYFSHGMASGKLGIIDK